MDPLPASNEEGIQRMPLVEFYLRRLIKQTVSRKAQKVGGGLRMR